MDDQAIAAIQPADVFRDAAGREWRLPSGGRPYFDQKWGTQGRWIAALVRTDSDGTRRMLLLHRSNSTTLEKMHGC